MRKLCVLILVLALVIIAAQAVQAVPNQSNQELGTLNANLVWNSRVKEWVAKTEDLSPGWFTLTYLYKNASDLAASRVVAGMDMDGYDSGPILRSEIKKFAEYKICEARYLDFSDKVVIGRCTWHLPIR